MKLQHDFHAILQAFIYKAQYRYIACNKRTTRSKLKRIFLASQHNNDWKHTTYFTITILDKKIQILNDCNGIRAYSIVTWDNLQNINCSMTCNCCNNIQPIKPRRLPQVCIMQFLYKLTCLAWGYNWKYKAWAGFQEFIILNLNNDSGHSVRHRKRHELADVITMYGVNKIKTNAGLFHQYRPGSQWLPTVQVIH